MGKIQKIGGIRRLVPAAVLFLFLALLPLQGGRAKAEESFRAKGIDVSRWQGTINWKQVKSDGIEFAMFGLGRLRGNTPEPDPNFKKNIEGALAQGIKAGAYLYSIALTASQARAEAEYVLDQIKGYKISYPVAFDIEDPSQMKLSKKTRTDITIAFLEVIEKAGYHPMIYASESWMVNSMDLSRLKKYDKWIARWGSQTSFKPLSMWQYSSTGRIKGISGNVDLDYSYKDYSKLLVPRTGPEEDSDEDSGWQTDGTDYWYVNANGKKLKNGFKLIGGETYYFDKKGYRAAGWETVDGKTYYFKKSTGAMAKGWIKQSGKLYYLDKETGVLATGWTEINGKRFYMDDKGALKKGWQEIDGKYYYLSKVNGRMLTGWLTKNGDKYYLDKKTGERAQGMKKIDGKYYAFSKKTGILVTNRDVGNYHADASGVLKKL